MTVRVHTDEGIKKDVLDELRWDMRLHPNEIGVIVKDGIVTLTGWIESYAQKLAASAAAHRVRGVNAVANDIEVRLAGVAEHTDTDLAATVLNTLKWAVGIPPGKIEVTVSQSWITLKGEVDYNFQKLDAAYAINRLKGVRGISNLITVKPQPLPENLKQKIEQALIRNAETDASSITAEVQDNKIILHGTVRSYAEKKAAEEISWSSPGVTEIDNRITVSLPR